MVGAAGGAAGSGTSGAGGAFEESLEDFDEIMGAEREAMASRGVGSAADEALGGATDPGGMA